MHGCCGRFGCFGIADTAGERERREPRLMLLLLPLRARRLHTHFMMEIAGTILVWMGIVAGAVGMVSILRPLRVLRIGTRKRGALVAGCGLLLLLIGMSLPASSYRAAGKTALDAWVPEWQFSEFHSARVKGTPEQVYKAIREVTADEIFLFRTLTWIRNPRTHSRIDDPSILNAPGKRPILDVALEGGFRLLADDPPREIVIATLVIWDGLSKPTDEAGLRELLRRPGNALATMNFQVRDEGNGWCTVTTETRIFATDPGARRQFARYWRVIYPGSSLLRYTWLQAIARRVAGDNTKDS